MGIHFFRTTHSDQKMTLDRLSERIAEANNKTDKVDGRRFNSRSQMKMKWEMRGISRAITKNRRRSSAGLHRGLYTKDEMEEYRVEQERVKEMSSVIQCGKEDGEKGGKGTPPSTTKGCAGSGGTIDEVVENEPRTPEGPKNVDK